MDPIVERGRRWLIAWVVLLLALIAATRLAIVFIAANGRDELPTQLMADAIAVAAVLYIVSGSRGAKWLGVLLFVAWGLFSIWIALRLGGAMTLNLRGEVIILVADGVWGVVVQTLSVLMGVVCLGFAGVLIGSRSVNQYLAYRRSRRA